MITIEILGSMCRLKNVLQIHKWVANDRISEFLKEKFGINYAAIIRYVYAENNQNRDVQSMF